LFYAFLHLFFYFNIFLINSILVVKFSLEILWNCFWKLFQTDIFKDKPSCLGRMVFSNNNKFDITLSYNIFKYFIKYPWTRSIGYLPPGNVPVFIDLTKSKPTYEYSQNNKTKIITVGNSRYIYFQFIWRTLTFPIFKFIMHAQLCLNGSLFIYHFRPYKVYK